MDRKAQPVELALFFVVGFLLSSPAWGLGLWSDDLGHAEFFRRALDGGAGAPPWWDMFIIEPGDVRRRFGGTLPWWSADSLRIALFRPVAAATHLLDHTVWPGQPWAMHVHSGAWFGACCVAMRVLAGRLAKLGAARIATAVFCIAFVHSSPVGWVAQRNALIATAFGLGAVAASIRHLRSGHRGAATATLGFLVAALLSSEGAIVAVVAVCLAPMVVPRARRRAAMLIAGALLITLAWRVGYSIAEYGAVGSGAYIDPIRSPAAFASALPGRATKLLLFHVWPRTVLEGECGPAAIAVAVLALGISVRGAFRAEPRLATYLALVLAASCIGLSAGAPHERLLGTSYAFFACIVGVAAAELPQRASVGVVAPLAAISLLGQAWGMVNHEFRLSDRDADTLAELDEVADVERRAVVAINPPRYGDFLTLQRAAASRGLAPRAWLVLSTGTPTASPSGCCTLSVPRVAAFEDPGARLYSENPLEVRRVETLWFTADVPGAGPLRFTFSAPLSSRQVVFVEWLDGRPSIRRFDSAE